MKQSAVSSRSIALRFSQLEFFSVLLGIPLVLMSCAAYAQLSSASVNGTVKDPSGAVIPGANVNIRATATGVSRTAATNNAGDYAFVDLDPGSYTLEVSKNGFSTAQQSAVTLSVNQTATFNFTLNVGSEVEKVTVNAPPFNWKPPSRTSERYSILWP